MQKIIWREGDQLKVARGHLDRVEGDLIFFLGESGPIIIGRGSLVAIK